MVNFNNETTVTRPATEIIRVLILQRRNDLIDALEFYQQKKEEGVSKVGLAVVQKRILGLWYELQAALKRTTSEEEYKRLAVEVKSKEYAKLEQAFLDLNEWMDTKKLIRIDDIKQYDSTLTELENAEKVA